MSRKQECGDKSCGHDRDSHYSEFPSTGDFTKPGGKVKEYFACTMNRCDCKKYVPSKD